MSAPPVLLPSSELVVQGWLRLAVPGVGVGDRLPELGKDAAVDEALQTVGFVRLDGIGGSPGRYVPMRSPVAFLACWVAPAAVTRASQWKRAGQLAERLVAATYDAALQGVLVDLSAHGNYAPARVHTVIALGEPARVPNDPSDFARVDVDLAFRWTGA